MRLPRRTFLESGFAGMFGLGGKKDTPAAPPQLPPEVLEHALTGCRTKAQDAYMQIRIRRNEYLKKAKLATETARERVHSPTVFEKEYYDYPQWLERSYQALQTSFTTFQAACDAYNQYQQYGAAPLSWNDLIPHVKSPHYGDRREHDHRELREALGMRLLESSDIPENLAELLKQRQHPWREPHPLEDKIEAALQRPVTEAEINPDKYAIYQGSDYATLLKHAKLVFAICEAYVLLREQSRKKFAGQVIYAELTLPEAEMRFIDHPHTCRVDDSDAVYIVASVVQELETKHGILNEKSQRTASLPDTITKEEAVLVDLQRNGEKLVAAAVHKCIERKRSKRNAENAKYKRQVLDWEAHRAKQSTQVAARTTNVAMPNESPASVSDALDTASAMATAATQYGVDIIQIMEAAASTAGAFEVMCKNTAAPTSATMPALEHQPAEAPIVGNFTEQLAAARNASAKTPETVEVKR